LHKLVSPPSQVKNKCNKIGEFPAEAAHQKSCVSIL